MPLYLLINHMLNFVAPAALVACLLVFFSRFFPVFLSPEKPLTPDWHVQLLINFAIGVDALVAGLLLLGRDGKMLTYVLLVLATATSQWWQLGGRREILRLRSLERV